MSESQRRSRSRLAQAKGRLKYSSPWLSETANRWKYHLKYQLSNNPPDPKYSFLRHVSIGDGVVLDVGANYGQSALSLRHFLPTNRILCVEANPGLVPALQLVEKRLTNCSYLVAAMSDEAGVATLNVPTFGSVPNTGGASLDEEFVGNRSEILEERYGSKMRSRRQLVAVATVDSLDLDVSLLKIDVEGFEANVLRGAAATISRCRPPVVMEILHSTGEAMELLVAADYRLLSWDGRRWTARTPSQAVASGDLDIVALPAEAEWGDGA